RATRSPSPVPPARSTSSARTSTPRRSRRSHAPPAGATSPRADRATWRPSIRRSTRWGARGSFGPRARGAPGGPGPRVPPPGAAAGGRGRPARARARAGARVEAVDPVNAALWTHPEWLAPLTALCAAAALALVHAGLSLRRRRRRLGAGLPGAATSPLRDALLWGALALLAPALAGPRIGSRVQRVPGSGVDVVFALDVSRSMEARDVPPSRLDVARRALEELLARLEPADRVALVAYAGRGVLLTPLTPDRD